MYLIIFKINAYFPSKHTLSTLSDIKLSLKQCKHNQNSRNIFTTAEFLRLNYFKSLNRNYFKSLNPDYSNPLTLNYSKTLSLNYSESINRNNSNSHLTPLNGTLLTGTNLTLPPLDFQIPWIALSINMFHVHYIQ